MADVLLPPPLLAPFPDALADGFAIGLFPSLVTAIRLTWISLSPSSPSLFKEGMAVRERGRRSLLLPLPQQAASAQECGSAGG